ncbi:MAG TPA: hypothetical protein VFI47_05580 [Acidimicrobiales bacterium]|nr:hypothetical protein [Acidimicrobiales bacterium]
MRIRSATASRAAPALVVAMGTLAVRVAVYASGDGFDAEHLGPLSMWHLLDPDVLRANPFAALWDVHTTPPLFNFLVGAVLAWSPLPDALSFQVLFTVGGVFGAVALYRVLCIVGCRAWVAVVAVLVVFSDPNMLGFEAHLSHEAVVTPMLLGVMWAVAAHADRPSAGRFGAVLAAGTVLVLTRAMFHPVWLAALVLVVALVRPPPLDRRRLALVAALPVVVVGGVMVKNEVRFGAFNMSSWAGMNLSRAAVYTLGTDRRERLVEDGVLSPVSSHAPFSPYADYAPDVPPCAAGFGTPALDAPLKSPGVGGITDVNYNYACFVPVYEQAQRDAVAAIRHEPSNYASTVEANTKLFLSDAPPGYSLAGLHGRVFDRLLAFHGKIDLSMYTVAQYPHLLYMVVFVQWTFVLGMAVVVAAGVRAAVRALRRRAGPGDVVVLAVALTVPYVSAAGVLLDSFENGRFRAPLDPLVLGILFGGGLELAARLVGRWAASRRARRPAGSGDPGARTSASGAASAAGLAGSGVASPVV